MIKALILSMMLLTGCKGWERVTCRDASGSVTYSVEGDWDDVIVEKGIIRKLSARTQRRMVGGEICQSEFVEKSK